MAEEMDTNLHEGSDFWFHKIGSDPVAFDSQRKIPMTPWKRLQEQILTHEEYENNKKQGKYDKGIAIFTGKIRRGENLGKHLVCIDIDNKKGIEEFLNETFSLFESHILSDLSKKTLIEQHEDAKDNKVHIFLITEIPIKKRGRIISAVQNYDDGAIPEIEVKSDPSTVVIVSPSIHKNGFPYKIIGTSEPLVLDEEQSKKLGTILDHVYDKFGIGKTDSQHATTSLPDELRTIAKSLQIDIESKHMIKAGARNNTLFSFARTLLNYHYGLTEIDFLKESFVKVNQKICVPPLEENEVDGIWNQAMGYSYANPKIRRYRDLGDRYFDQSKLSDKLPEKNFVEYVVNTTKKTVKREDTLIKLILYSGLSAYTNDPLNLGIIAPTSEGKSYAVSQTIKLLPRQDVWMLGSMSSKVLIRDKGVLVDNDNNQPIKDKIQEITNKIKHEKDDQKKQELEEDRNALYENSKVLIDLSNKVLVFLEPSHPETWDILKPILSHDAPEIEHPYVYKTETRGQEVKHIVTRGWPACIFCSAKDDSSWSMWPEIQSRFLIKSPNMVKQKYLDSNTLIAQKKGLPQLVQAQLIVSEEELQLAQDCVLLIKEELQKTHKNNVWIPFQSILSQSLPSEKGTDVRITSRIFSLLSLITKIKSFKRLKINMNDETLAVSSPLDLEEVLKLTHNITGIPSYKLEFLTDILIPLFLSKHIPLEKENIIEDKIAVYTNELADYYKQIKRKTLTTDAIKKTYLIELKNNGFIDDFQSIVDKRKHGYYPLIDTEQFMKPEPIRNRNYTNIREIDNNLQYFNLGLSNNYNKIDKDWLNVEILELLKYGIGQTNIFKLLDEDNHELCICRFIQKYNISGELNRYFHTEEKCIYSSKVFGKILKM